MDIPFYGSRVQTLLTEARRVLLIIHPLPDADAVGSAAAFGQWLSTLGTAYTIFCVDQPPTSLSWLVNFQPFVTDSEIVLRETYDAVITLDCSDLRYAGAVSWINRITPVVPIINIDHHATNSRFGEINIVDTNAASTTEILFYFFKDRGVMITPTMADALLAGLIFDTYNFTNPNTSRQSLAVASALLSAGGSLTKISETVMRTKTVPALQAWGQALARLSFNSRWNTVSTVVTAEDVVGGAPAPEVAEGAANFLNNLGGVKAALILNELPGGIIKGSLRTNDVLIDVSKLAIILGGGGHKKAAGFRLKGRLVKTDAGYWQVE